jgi:hypothetical protein
MVAPRQGNRRALVGTLYTALLGCAALDQSFVQELAEVRVRGDGQAATRGDAVPTDLIPVQTLLFDLPATPAAIFVERVTLRVTATDRPPGDVDDLAFLKRVRCYIEPSTPGSTLPRRLVAWRDGPGEGPTLELDTVRAQDITSYLTEGAQIVAEVVGAVPPDDVSFGMTAEVFVDAL